jgi:hypothetical protein
MLAPLQTDSENIKTEKEQYRIKSATFWDATLCTLAEVYPSFRGMLTVSIYKTTCALFQKVLLNTVTVMRISNLPKI